MTIQNVKIFDTNNPNCEIINSPSEIRELLNDNPPVFRLTHSTSIGALSLRDIDIVGYVSGFRYNNKNEYFGDVMIFPKFHGIKGILKNYQFEYDEPMKNNRCKISRIVYIEME